MDQENPAASTVVAPIRLPTRWLRHWRVLPGGVILAAAFLAGEWLKARLGLIIPGNILGLFLLLGLLLMGALPVRWVEEAAAVLLWLLPLLFMPIFAASAEDKAFWAQSGGSFFAAALVGVVALWALVGRLAQFFLRRHDLDQTPDPTGGPTQP